MMFRDTTFTFLTGVDEVVSPVLPLEEEEVVGRMKAGRLLPFRPTPLLLLVLPPDRRGPNSGLGGGERREPGRSPRGLEVLD